MTDIFNAALPVLTDWRLLGAALATALAGLMRGYAGFGTAVLLAPAYSVLWGPRIGIPVMLLMELAVSIQLLPKAFGDANRRVILPIGAAALMATPVGAFILLTADGGPAAPLHRRLRAGLRPAADVGLALQRGPAPCPSISADRHAGGPAQGRDGDERPAGHPVSPGGAGGREDSTGPTLILFFSPSSLSSPSSRPPSAG
jgi:hypothetical protein